MPRQTQVRNGAASGAAGLRRVVDEHAAERALDGRVDDGDGDAVATTALGSRGAERAEVEADV